MVAAAAAPVAAPVHACPRPARAAELRIWRGGGIVHGDVDGDRRADRVVIRYEPRALASCAFLLTVEMRGRTLALRVPEFYKPPDRAATEWPFSGEPAVAMLVRLSRRGAQIVVRRSHGASVVSVSIYGVVRGRLSLLRFPAPSTEGLALFGTVGTGDTEVHCRRGGALVVLGRSPTSLSGRRWRLSRTEYRLAARRFRRARAWTVVVSSTGADLLSRRWRFDARPFSGCIVARGVGLS